MTKINSTYKFSAAAAFGAAALFSMLSMGSTAQASSVLSCKGTSASGVKSCCEEMVKENGRPMWMIHSGTSCNKAVVCRKGGHIIGIAAVAPIHCYIHIVDIFNEDKHKEPPRELRTLR